MSLLKHQNKELVSAVLYFCDDLPSIKWTQQYELLFVIRVGLTVLYTVLKYYSALIIDLHGTYWVMFKFIHQNKPVVMAKLPVIQ